MFVAALAKLSKQDAAGFFGKAQAALRQLAGPEAEDLLLRCLELLPVRTGDVALAPLLAGLRSKEVEVPRDEARARAHRALAAVVALVDLDRAAALGVLERWAGLSEATPDEAQLGVLQRMAGELEKENRLDELQRSQRHLLLESARTAEATINKLEAAERYRDAAILARRLGLEDRSKKLWIADGRAVIRKAVQADNPIKAVPKASRHPAAQRYFLDQLLEVGMLDLALERAAAWNRTLQTTSEMQALRDARSARYFSIPSAVQVQVVDTEAEIGGIFEELQAAPAVGLDVECSMDTKPVLLQLATEDSAFLFDLMRLGSSKKLGKSLVGLFADTSTEKLIFGGPDDVTLLGRLPGLRSCSTGPCKPCVDLQQVARKALKEKNQVGLSRVAGHFLGLPLDKSMQASDWTSRPLVAAQQHYAALDAWVLTELHALLSPAAP